MRHDRPRQNRSWTVSRETHRLKPVRLWRRTAMSAMERMPSTTTAIAKPPVTIHCESAGTAVDEFPSVTCTRDQEIRTVTSCHLSNVTSTNLGGELGDAERYTYAALTHRRWRLRGSEQRYDVMDRGRDSPIVKPARGGSLQSVLYKHKGKVHEPISPSMSTTFVGFC